MLPRRRHVSVYREIGRTHYILSRISGRTADRDNRVLLGALSVGVSIGRGVFLSDGNQINVNNYSIYICGKYWSGFKKRAF